MDQPFSARTLSTLSPARTSTASCSWPQATRARHAATRAGIRRMALISRLLAEELLDAIRRTVRDVGDELTVEQELLAAHRQHHQLARFEVRDAGAAGLFRKARRGGVEIEQRIEQRRNGVPF